MKTLKAICTATVLAFALSVPVYAGDIDTPACQAPRAGDVQSPAASLPGDSQTPGFDGSIYTLATNLVLSLAGLL